MQLSKYIDHIVDTDDGNSELLDCYFNDVSFDCYFLLFSQHTR